MVERICGKTGFKSGMKKGGVMDDDKGEDDDRWHNTTGDSCEKDMESVELGLA